MRPVSCLGRSIYQQSRHRGRRQGGFAAAHRTSASSCGAALIPFSIGCLVRELQIDLSADGFVRGDLGHGTI